MAHCNFHLSEIMLFNVLFFDFCTVVSLGHTYGFFI